MYTRNRTAILQSVKLPQKVLPPCDPGLAVEVSSVFGITPFARPKGRLMPYRRCRAVERCPCPTCESPLRRDVTFNAIKNMSVALRQERILDRVLAVRLQTRYQFESATLDPSGDRAACSHLRNVLNPEVPAHSAPASSMPIARGETSKPAKASYELHELKCKASSGFARID